MAVTPITTTPPLIDAALVQFYGTFNCFSGPIDHAGDLYAALFDVATVQLQIVKSTDSGATWSRVDDGAGATIITAGVVPVFGSASLIVWLFVALDSGGGSSPNFIDAQEFDLTSDTFGAIVADVTTDPAGSGQTFGVYRSDGSIVMLYPLIVAGISEAWASVYAAGAFGAAFQVDAEPAESVGPIGAVLDSSDVTHVIDFDATSGDFRYSTIDAGNVVTGPEPVPAISSASAVLDHPVADSGTLAFPYTDGSGAHARAKALIGTGATNDPATASWTVYDVWTAGLDATSEDSKPYAIMDGADLLVFWINTTAAGIARVYWAKFNGGGFDAPTLFYDSSLFPPAGATVDPTMRGLSVVNLAGAFVGIVGMNIDGTGFQSFYLKSGTATSGYRNRIY